MTLIYYGSCKDINDNVIKVEFYKNSTTSYTAKEVLLAADPVTVEYTQDNILSPFRKSGASINLLVPNVYYDLYSADWLDVQVRIYKNSQLFWFGYVTPQLYSHPYNEEYEELTIECVDTISLLEQKKIEYDDLTDVLSFEEYFQTLFNVVDPDNNIKNIYVHQLLTTTDGKDIYDKYGVLARNFFDEELEPATLEEVAEGILHYLNLTLFQWGDSYYMISFPDLKNHNSFYKYSRSGSKTSTTINNTTYNVSNIGVHETNGTVEIGEIYHKISIIANTNPNNEGIPSPMDDDLVNQNADPEKIYLHNLYLDEEEDKTYQLISSYWKSKGNWKYTIPTNNSNTKINEVTLDNVETITKGTFWARTQSYQVDGESPDSLEFDTHITAIRKDGDGYDQEIVSLNKKVNNIFKGGLFIVELKYFFSDHNLPFKVYDSKEYDEEKASEKQIIKFPMRFAFKDKYYYWNHTPGTHWRSYDEYNRKVACGYYFKPVEPEPTVNTHPYWYKIWRGEFYEYVSYKTYGESSVSNKLSGACESNVCYYFWDENNYAVAVPNDFGLECLFGDRCYLWTTIKEGDPIFFEDKKVDNTVTWSMKLEEPADGQILLTNDKTLVGDLVIDLYAPHQLGGYIQGTSKRVTALHISDFRVTYATHTGKFFSENESEEEDIIYSNNDDENSSLEHDDILMTVNTYSTSATSYSYVVDVNSEEMAGEVYNNATKTTAIPEEQLVNKYMNHYQTPRIAYTNTLNNANLTPYSILKENNLNKTMVTQSITYKMGDDAAEIMIKDF